MLGAILLAGCGSIGTLEDRPGATVAQARADHQSCHERVAAQPELYIPPQSTLSTAAGAGAIAGVSSVIAEEKAVDVCMQRDGYVRRTLTEAEKKSIAAAPRGAARDAAINAVLRANDAPQDNPDA